MYSVLELIILAKAYLAATKIAESTLGLRAAQNDKLFVRLFQGKDCLASSVEEASDWFDRNWPEGVSWPREVQRRSTAARGRRMRIKRPYPLTRQPRGGAKREGSAAPLA